VGLQAGLLVEHDRVAADAVSAALHSPSRALHGRMEEKFQ
jgi:hypothetical protein